MMIIEFAPPTEPMSYDDAVVYCFFLSYNGHTGWRIPTKHEYNYYSKLGGTWSWYVDRPTSIGPIIRSVIPVRTYDRNCTLRKPNDL